MSGTVATNTGRKAGTDVGDRQPLSSASRTLRLVALGVALVTLSACKYESDGASPSGSTPPTPPPTPTAYSRVDAPLVSSSGALTLERYADTTSAIGGPTSNSKNTLTHDETAP